MSEGAKRPTNDEGRTTNSPGRSWVVGRGSWVVATLAAATALWFVTGWIQRRWGLDSVAALLVNIGLFIAVGWALGAAAARGE